MKEKKMSAPIVLTPARMGRIAAKLEDLFDKKQQAVVYIYAPDDIDVTPQQSSYGAVAAAAC
ncbi:MAG: hypothetical protein NT141_01445 [candidate division WWE3 bacterium]|nr:hypothetical protein [candidate division WWE3 bacterium]